MWGQSDSPQRPWRGSRDRLPRGPLPRRPRTPGPPRCPGRARCTASVAFLAWHILMVTTRRRQPAAGRPGSVLRPAAGPSPAVTTPPARPSRCPARPSRCPAQSSRCPASPRAAPSAYAIPDGAGDVYAGSRPDARVVPGPRPAPGGRSRPAAARHACDRRTRVRRRWRTRASDRARPRPAPDWHVAVAGARRRAGHGSHAMHGGPWRSRCRWPLNP